MNIKAQIEFKSIPDMFDKEQSGIKNNTQYLTWLYIKDLHTEIIIDQLYKRR